MTCTCQNGIANIGINCLRNNELSCESCHDSFQLVAISPFIYECSKEVECSCLAGEVLKNSSCTNLNPEKCSSCKPFYHLNETTSTCDTNKCSCQHGYPLFQCEINLDESCLFCDDGYHLENIFDKNIENSVEIKKCSKNVCQCNNGYPANFTNSKICPNHRTDFCVDCLPSHQLFSGTCIEKTCICLNGNPSKHKNCPEIGAHHCGSCNNHYKLGVKTAKCYPKIYSSCASSPCGDDGDCRVLSADYIECYCKLGFTGPFCDKVNHCYEYAPCLNGGFCKLDYSTDRGYVCACSDSVGQSDQILYQILRF